VYLSHVLVWLEPVWAARWVRRNDRAPIVTRDAA
jgi:hypothetical protein